MVKSAPPETPKFSLRAMSLSWKAPKSTGPVRPAPVLNCTDTLWRSTSGGPPVYSLSRRSGRPSPLRSIQAMSACSSSFWMFTPPEKSKRPALKPTVAPTENESLWPCSMAPPGKSVSSENR